VSIEEAQLAGIETVIRSIPALVSLGFDPGIRTPADMAHRIAMVLPDEITSPPPARPSNPSREADLDQQSRSLRAAYRTAADSASRRLQTSPAGRL
jgi:hypothetical protein